MSRHIGGQVRALPFTGFASLLFVLVELLLSGLRLLMTNVRPKAKSLDTGCHPPYSASHRFVVYARLESQAFRHAA